MDFTALNKEIPYVMGGRKHVLTMHPYDNITLALPGRHAADTVPMGGDFVVMVDDVMKGWNRHQFTHVDIFNDVERKRYESHSRTMELMQIYGEVIHGRDPDEHEMLLNRGVFSDSIHPQTFIHAVQCLAVAEHRRYGQYEKRGGGRFLPFRFALGIAEGLWTAADCAAQQKRGRPGLDYLIKKHGDLTPLTTWEGPW